MTAVRKLKHYIFAPYNLLLVILLLLFIFRPFHTAVYYPAVWKCFMTFGLLLAIFDVHHRKWVKIISLVLAIPALIFSWLFLITKEAPFEVLTISFTTAFLLICTCSIIYDVVLRARVTIETLKGVISAYFLFAFLFGYLFTLIELMVPGSFMILGKSEFSMSVLAFFAEMFYFSFVTLLTIGYGDIVAVKELAQTAVVIEGVIGQFYVAILVARIVAVYSLYSGQSTK